MPEKSTSCTWHRPGRGRKWPARGIVVRARIGSALYLVAPEERSPKSPTRTGMKRSRALRRSSLHEPTVTAPSSSCPAPTQHPDRHRPYLDQVVHLPPLHLPLQDLGLQLLHPRRGSHCHALLLPRKGLQPVSQDLELPLGPAGSARRVWSGGRGGKTTQQETKLFDMFAGVGLILSAPKAYCASFDQVLVSSRGCLLPPLVLILCLGPAASKTVERSHACPNRCVGAADLGSFRRICELGGGGGDKLEVARVAMKNVPVSPAGPGRPSPCASRKCRDTVE